jgi:hypothetical protein
MLVLIEKVGSKFVSTRRLSSPQRYDKKEDYWEKYCGKCKEWWPATTEFFYSNKSSSDGLYQWCTACYLEYHRRKYPPKVRTYEQSERNKEIVRMRDGKTTFERIGKVYSISRQRAHQIYKVWSMKQ